MSVIDIAQKEFQKHGGSNIDEIELDIGELSGVEMNAFEFAWEQAVKNTVLHQSLKKVNRINGEAFCIDCNSRFPIHQLYDACQQCGNQLLTIEKGKELRVKSLIIS